MLALPIQLLTSEEFRRRLGALWKIFFCRSLYLDNSPRGVMIAESAVTFLPDRKFVL